REGRGGRFVDARVAGLARALPVWRDPRRRRPVGGLQLPVGVELGDGRWARSGKCRQRRPRWLNREPRLLESIVGFGGRDAANITLARSRRKLLLFDPEQPDLRLEGGSRNPKLG